MAFFTHCYKKTNRWIVFAFLMLMLSVAWAGASVLNIKMAELVLIEDTYQLNADLDIGFSEQIEDALSKGVALNFLVEFQVVSPRKYWFDDEIVTATNTVTLSYHALSRQYLLQHNQHQQSFSSLQEAKAEFAKIRNWKVLEKALLNKEDTYKATLLVRLDQSKLPKPLQVDAISSESWNMTSQRYTWAPALTGQ